ncbi:MAG: peroxiredoxin [Acidimicrobiia bacterium]
MPLQLGDEAPNFKAQTTQGDISLHEYLGDSWGILFSHPKDFTPVCTTELGTVASLEPEFNKRNTKVLALSVDPLDSHMDWLSDIEDVCANKVNYPVIADDDKAIANKYGMIHPNANDSLTVRSVFIINPDKKIALTLTYPAPVGRNFEEILRVLDALQLGSQYKVATPANWEKGDDVIISGALSDEDAKQLFPDGWDAKKPYLRFVKDPSSK